MARLKPPSSSEEDPSSQLLRENESSQVKAQVAPQVPSMSGTSTLSGRSPSKSHSVPPLDLSNSRKEVNRSIRATSDPNRVVGRDSTLKRGQSGGTRTTSAVVALQKAKNGGLPTVSEAGNGSSKPEESSSSDDAFEPSLVSKDLPPKTNPKPSTPIQQNDEAESPAIVTNSQSLEADKSLHFIQPSSEFTNEDKLMTEKVKCFGNPHLLGQIMKRSNILIGLAKAAYEKSSQKADPDFPVMPDEVREIILVSRALRKHFLWLYESQFVKPVIDPSQDQIVRQIGSLCHRVTLYSDIKSVETEPQFHVLATAMPHLSWTLNIAFRYYNMTMRSEPWSSARPELGVLQKLLEDTRSLCSLAVLHNTQSTNKIYVDAANELRHSLMKLWRLVKEFRSKANS